MDFKPGDYIVNKVTGNIYKIISRTMIWGIPNKFRVFSFKKKQQYDTFGIDVENKYDKLPDDITKLLYE